MRVLVDLALFERLKKQFDLPAISFVVNKVSFLQPPVEMAAEKLPAVRKNALYSDTPMKQSKDNLAGKSFDIRFWGVRGSYPTTDARTLGVGGNTSCVEVSVAGRRLIFDAGTGIIPLGQSLERKPALRAPSYIFLSHTHIDHIIGLAFFAPLLTVKTRSFIYGPGAPGHSLAERLDQMMRTSLFPVSLTELKGEKQIHSLHGHELLQLSPRHAEPILSQSRAESIPSADAVTVATLKSPAHPRDGVMLYRVGYGGKSLVYATDVEQQEGGYPEIIDFAQGADLLIHDAQYLRREYYSKTKSKRGWGHSTVDMAAAVAKKAKVKRLVLFHHEPLHDDRTMKAIGRHGKRLYAPSVIAREGMEISLL